MQPLVAMRYCRPHMVRLPAPPCHRSNRGGTRRCHEEVISTRDLQKAVDFVSGVAAWLASLVGESLALHCSEQTRNLKRYPLIAEMQAISSLACVERPLTQHCSRGGGGRSLTTGSCGPCAPGRLLSRPAGRDDGGRMPSRCQAALEPGALMPHCSVHVKCV